MKSIEAVRKAMVLLAEAFGKEITELDQKTGKRVPRPIVAIYEDALSDLSVEEIEFSAKRAMRELKWFPKPAELRELVRPPQAAISIDDRAMRAWDVCSRHLSFYETLEFDDPLIHATVRACGGVEAVLDAEEKFMRPQFLKMYGALARTGIDQDQAGPLIGWLDRENDRAGYAKRQPVYKIPTGLPLLPNCQHLKLGFSPSEATPKAAPAISFKEIPG